MRGWHVFNLWSKVAKCFLKYNVLEQFEDEWGARGVFNMSEEGKASIVIQKGIVFPVKH